MAVESNLVYAKNLITAGWDGVRSARNELDGDVFTPLARKSAVWTSTALGAAIGVLSTLAIRNRKSVFRMGVGGLAGSLVGFGGGVAWTSRRFTETAAVRALRQVNNVRDAHWLQRNPIAYG
jgi:hypothetical protein